ncbi:MAG TPA: Gfo/Idh/MocA family oxidoreductase, partial [Acidimicrobiales bacterium]|nr:Gfo/Idh/MocA family oxidoreductase [Acidimicrobiales bacterium]
MRIVVIGSGRMGELRARLLAEDPAVGEVALAGRESARLHEVAEGLDLPVVPLEGALEGAVHGADGVVICTATSSHAELLATAIEAGVTTLCEKPLAGELAQTTALAERAEERGVTVQVGYHRRFDPAMAAMRQEVGSGRAGTLYTLRLLSHDHVLSPPEFIPGSGGIFRDLHVHDFDLLRWLTGREVDTVFATGSLRLHDRYAASGDVDTSAIV